MAVTLDIGEASNIHPIDRWDVGKRLALPAFAKLYGQSELVWSGPMYQSIQIKDNTVRLAFGYAEGGLKFIAGSKITGFAIAGSDNKWYWADATIEKDIVVVSSSSVTNPVRVRYGWANNPPCNLFNAAGLQVYRPLRSDPMGSRSRLGWRLRNMGT